MENIEWMALIPILIPSVVALILAIGGFILKLKKDSMTGMSKELSELVLSILEASKDRKFTNAELQLILKEGQDVIEEAKKLLHSS